MQGEGADDGYQDADSASKIRILWSGWSTAVDLAGDLVRSETKDGDR